MNKKQKSQEPNQTWSPQFYIPATSSLYERRPRTLQHEDVFGLFDHYGDVVSGIGSPEGIFFEDTRYVSRYELLVNDKRPLLLSSVVQDNNLLFAVDLTNPDCFSGEDLVLPREALHIVRTKFMREAKCFERVHVHNFSLEPQNVNIGFVFSADFSDIFEVRGHKRTVKGVVRTPCVSYSDVTLSYVGVDTVLRQTKFEFTPAPDRLDGESASFDIALGPRERTSVFVCMSCDQSETESDAPAGGYFRALRRAHRERAIHTRSSTEIETSNPVFNELVSRCRADIRMLSKHTGHGLFPYAGTPWFNTVFGRDSLITAIQLLWLEPQFARGVLMHLATLQAMETNPATDAQPGKILHEKRQGEMSRVGEVPFGLYYGSVDSTPLFVILAGMYLERTGDVETITEIWHNIEAAVRWLDQYADLDGDGFVEYLRAAETGLANQGWKDSDDSIFHADGTLAKGPIALCEAQAFAYAARSSYANMAKTLTFSKVASTEAYRANDIRQQFEEHFWNDDIGTYGIALDGGKNLCAVRSSNAGYALFAGIARPEKARLVADNLMSQKFFSGWGIRTIANTEARYNPMSYHNGSIWPHDNALIALGMSRYQLTDHVTRLFSGLFDAAGYMFLKRLPELFCGFKRFADRGPTFYPVACSPQAWAAAAPIAMLQACLGMTFLPSEQQVRLERPRLPAFLDRVVVKSLKCGETSLDLAIKREANGVSVNVLRKEGEGNVCVIA